MDSTVNLPRLKKGLTKHMTFLVRNFIFTLTHCSIPGFFSSSCEIQSRWDGHSEHNQQPAPNRISLFTGFHKKYLKRTDAVKWLVNSVRSTLLQSLVWTVICFYLTTSSIALLCTRPQTTGSAVQNGRPVEPWLVIKTKHLIFR